MGTFFDMINEMIKKTGVYEEIFGNAKEQKPESNRNSGGADWKGQHEDAAPMDNRIKQVKTLMDNGSSFDEALRTVSPNISKAIPWLPGREFGTVKPARRQNTTDTAMDLADGQRGIGRDQELAARGFNGESQKATMPQSVPGRNSKSAEDGDWNGSYSGIGEDIGAGEITLEMCIEAAQNPVPEPDMIQVIKEMEPDYRKPDGTMREDFIIAVAREYSKRKEAKRQFDALIKEGIRKGYLQHPDKYKSVFDVEADTWAERLLYMQEYGWDGVNLYEFYRIKNDPSIKKEREEYLARYRKDLRHIAEEAHYDVETFMQLAKERGYSFATDGIWKALRLSFDKGLTGAAENFRDRIEINLTAPAAFDENLEEAWIDAQKRGDYRYYNYLKKFVDERRIAQQQNVQRVRKGTELQQALRGSFIDETLKDALGIVKLANDVGEVVGEAAPTIAATALLKGLAGFGSIGAGGAAGAGNVSAALATTYAGSTALTALPAMDTYVGAGNLALFAGGGLAANALTSPVVNLPAAQGNALQQALDEEEMKALGLEERNPTDPVAKALVEEEYLNKIIHHRSIPETTTEKSLSEKNESTYSPANPGPLEQDIAETFRGAIYSEKILTQDTCFYRVYGGKTKKIGNYMTRVPQYGSIQSQIDLALNPKWENSAEYVTIVIVPKGTRIFEGTTALQLINDGTGMLIGGGNQIYIPEVDADWFTD